MFFFEAIDAWWCVVLGWEELYVVDWEKVLGEPSFVVPLSVVV